MQPKHCVADNFGSFRHLEFDFSDLGLTLISGPTGAGKSSLCDIVPWTLFGVTSKDGAADEIRSWGCDEATAVTLEVDTPAGALTVVRIRGTAAQNDLYWTEAGVSGKHRGKNLLDTQELLTKRLGVDANLYLLGAYFSQFSAADEFFTAKAKDRRSILERITDVSKPVTLAKVASEARKVAKKELETLELKRAELEGQRHALQKQKFNAEKSVHDWDMLQAALIEELEGDCASFATENEKKKVIVVNKLAELAEREKIDEDIERELADIDVKLTAYEPLDAEFKQQLAVSIRLQTELKLAKRELKLAESATDICPACRRGGLRELQEKYVNELRDKVKYRAEQFCSSTEQAGILDAKLASKNELIETRAMFAKAKAENGWNKMEEWLLQGQLQSISSSINIYSDRLIQAREARNPHYAQLLQAKSAIADSAIDLSNTNGALIKAAHKLSSLNCLYDLSFVWRGELLHNAVAALQRDTNSRLDTYFDGVFRVKFALEDSDKLTVDITSNGHSCSFKALSGGERRQLTLAFWRALSVRAADAAGVSFPMITMDESFNGLSDALKAKAFRLLEEIAKDASTVLVIDHSEALKSMFDNVFTITKVGEESSLASGVESKQAA